MTPRAPMKPETIARRAAEHATARAAQSAECLRRIAEKAEQEGPASIWAEMLAEHDARRSA